MNRKLTRRRFVCGALAVLFTFSWGQSASADWFQWRGPTASGSSPDGHPPVEWSETKNVRWKIAVPGKGHSTPIVTENRIFLTAAIPIGEAMPPKFSGAPGAHDNSPVTHRHQFVAIAIDRSDGKIVWQKKLGEAIPHEGGHYSGSLASASPCTDGELLFAYFGSYGIYCLNQSGELVWKKDLGRMDSKHGHGEGSSPVLADNTLAINWDHEGQSFVVALDKRTGNEIWKSQRDEVTSWSTPIVVDHNGQQQLVVCGTDRVRAYNLKDGKVIWQCGGLSANIVASPVSSDGVLYAGSSYEKRAFLAIRLEGAHGDITDSQQILWRRFRGTPYVPSPLLYGDSLYFLAHYQNVLTRMNAKSGRDTPGAIRLDSLRNIYASPVGAADCVYITDLNGVTMVIRHDDQPEVLAVNQLNDRFNASAAIDGKQMFLRGEQYLYCLQTDDSH